MYLSFMATNASGERSFSKLKLINYNEKITCTHQDRLNWLSLMAIESEVLQQIEFEDIIERFVAAKCRKVVKL